MKKVYVSGKFEDIKRVRRVYQKIEQAGLEIVYDWTTHQPIKPYGDNQELAQKYSTNELTGIAQADVFIYYCDEKGTTSLMEFGAALALKAKRGKPLVYAVGKMNDKSPWFFNKQVQRRDSIDEVIKEIS